MSVEAKLDAVTRARAAYVLARTTLESKLREQLKSELALLQTQVDIAVRYAHDAGASKASILRAMGVKDYGTVKSSLDRTRGVEEVIGVDPLDTMYSFDPESGKFTARYKDYGPQSISGVATFDFIIMADQTKWFMPIDSLWNEDYTIKNEVVAALGNRQDGFYYEEALSWVEQQWNSGS